MAASLLMVLPPVLIFFFAQRLFIQGVVVSGIKG
jgi:multiple sugar transport system permease protein